MVAEPGVLSSMNKSPPIGAGGWPGYCALAALISLATVSGSTPLARSLKAAVIAWASSLASCDVLLMVALPAVLLPSNSTSAPRLSLALLLVMVALPAVLLSVNPMTPTTLSSALLVMLAWAAVLAF